MQCSKEFANRRYTKGVPFLSKLVFSSGKGLDRGAEPPRVKPLSTPERCLLWDSVRIKRHVLLSGTGCTGFGLKTVKYNPHGMDTIKTGMKLLIFVWIYFLRGTQRQFWVVVGRVGRGKSTGNDFSLPPYSNSILVIVCIVLRLVLR